MKIRKLHMRATFIAGALLLSGCGGRGAGADADGGTSAGGVTPASASPSSATAPAGPAKQDKATSVTKKAADAGKGKAASSASPNFGTAVLAYPDDLQMTMLAYRLTDREPPFADWATEAYEVRTADEFSRTAQLETEIARLGDIYASTEGAGYIQIRLNSQLSQYDSSRGGYYLTAFSPGNQVNYGGTQQVSLQMDNMANAFFWPMDAARAQEILEHTSRRVDIDTKMKITGIQRRSNGIVIRGDIVEYGIYSDRYNDERLLEQINLD